MVERVQNPNPKLYTVSSLAHLRGHPRAADDAEHLLLCHPRDVVLLAVAEVCAPGLFKDRRPAAAKVRGPTRQPQESKVTVRVGTRDTKGRWGPFKVRKSAMVYWQGVG